MPGVSPPWWHPERYAARRPLLIRRNRVIAAIREYFAQEGFVEVETPALQVSPGIEPYLKRLHHADRRRARGGKGVLHLHTSPEYAMKKLLVSGEPRIFQLARCYPQRRARADAPPGIHHAGMVPGGGYLSRHHAGTAKASCAPRPGADGVFGWQGKASDPHRPWQYLSVAEAFQHYAGIDLLATAPDPQRPRRRRPAGRGAPDRATHG
jgi:lysyl-tRNA synthetase class 2